VPAPDAAMDTWVFLPIRTGEAVLAVMFSPAAGIHDTIKVPVRIRSPNSAMENRLKISMGKEKKLFEYFNLRGQKLPFSGIKRTDGIVLERMIRANGNISIRKINPAIKSR
jgi:hypothetical protein